MTSRYKKYVNYKKSVGQPFVGYDEFKAYVKRMNKLHSK